MLLEYYLLPGSGGRNKTDPYGSGFATLPLTLTQHIVKWKSPWYEYIFKENDFCTFKENV